MINNNDSSYFNYTPTGIKENKFSIGVNNNNKDFFNYCDNLINIPQFTLESNSYRVENLIQSLDILTGEYSIYYDLKQISSKLSDVTNAIPQLEKLNSISLNKIDYLNNISNMIKQVLSLSLNVTSMLANNSKANTSASSPSAGIGIAMEVLNLVGNISTMTTTILNHKETMKNYDSMISDLNKQIELLDKDLKLAKETYDTLYKPNRMFKAKSNSTIRKI